MNKLRCPVCYAAMDVSRDDAPQVACGKCGRVVTPTAEQGIGAESDPPPVSAIAPVDEVLSQEQILNAFAGGIEPVQVTTSYRLGAVLVAIFMLILPLVYVGLIALVGYGVYWHATSHRVWLSADVPGQGFVLILLAYGIPIIAGAVLVLFMIKPLFARLPSPGRERTLTSDDEPLLFAFVDRICEIVRAPRPKRIDLDCQANASAGFRRGLISFLGGEMVLTIGLPLVAGLSMREFAGVLAHEFGHFSQGAGMRLTLIIRSISIWFARVVYERDQWDVWLRDAVHEQDKSGVILFYPALFLVWATRKILFFLMLLGSAASGFLLRQMEFDADRYETRLAGEDAFENTCRKVVTLNVAAAAAYADLGRFRAEGRLGDNLPKMIVANVSRLSRAQLLQIEKLCDEATTGWLDTHPSNKERIDNARRERTKGVFQLAQPATSLFKDFDAVAGEVTLDFYEDLFELELKAEDLQSTEDLLERQIRDEADIRSMLRLFQAPFAVLRPLPLPAAQPVGELVAVEDAKQRLQLIREEQLRGVGDYQELVDLRGQALRGASEAYHIGKLLSAGVPARRIQFDAFQSIAAAEKGCLEHLATLKSIGEQMSAWEALVATRVELALTLLPKVRGGAGVGDPSVMQSTIARWLRGHHALAQISEQRLAVRFEHIKLRALTLHLHERGEQHKFLRVLLKQMDVTRGAVNSLRATLEKEPYPLDHVDSEMTIGRYLLAEPLEDSRDLGKIFQSSEAVCNMTDSLVAIILGRLAAIVEKVETAIGLPPLPDPQPQDEQEEEDESAQGGGPLPWEF